MAVDQLYSWRMGMKPLKNRETKGEEDWRKPGKGLFRKQKNVAKHRMKVRGWQATGSDRDASQIPCVPNGTRGYTTTTTTTSLIAVFTKAPFLTLSWAISVQFTYTRLCFSKMHFNIILPSVPGTPKLQSGSFLKIFQAKLVKHRKLWHSSSCYCLFHLPHITQHSILTGCRVYNHRILVWFPVGSSDLLLSKASKPPLGPTQLLVPWVPASLSVGI